MGIGSGMDMRVGYGIESTPDVPVAIAQHIPALDESLEQERERKEGGGIIAGRRIIDSGMRVLGKVNPHGSVSHELYNKGLGKLFTGMFGTVSSTTGPVSGIYTHTWTGINAPVSLTVQKGTPRVALGNATVDPYTYSGAMIESWDMKCAAAEIATFAASFSCVREIGYRQVTDGATNTNTTVTSLTAAFTQADKGMPISGTGIPSGTTIASVESATSVTISAAATATATGVTITIGIALASPTYPSGLMPFTGNNAALTVAGGAIKVREWSMSRKSGLATDRYNLGSPYRDVPIENDLHGISGTLNMEYASQAMYTRFLAGSTAALVAGFSNPAGESVTFTTTVMFDGATAKAGGRDIILQEVPYMMTDTTDAGAFSVVVKSTDSTP